VWLLEIVVPAHAKSQNPVNLNKAYAKWTTQNIMGREKFAGLCVHNDNYESYIYVAMVYGSWMPQF